MDTGEALKKRQDSWVEAVTSQNIEKIMEHYAPQVRAFDAVAQLQFCGRDEYGEHWRKCLTACTLTAFEVAELQIETEGDLAVLTFLNRCGGKDEKGEENSCWMRASQIYRLFGQDWQIIHEHFSLPFDMQSGEVMFNLSPETTT